MDIWSQRDCLDGASQESILQAGVANFELVQIGSSWKLSRNYESLLYIIRDINILQCLRIVNMNNNEHNAVPWENGHLRFLDIWY